MKQYWAGAIALLSQGPVLSPSSAIVGYLVLSPTLTLPLPLEKPCKTSNKGSCPGEPFPAPASPSKEDHLHFYAVRLYVEVTP